MLAHIAKVAAVIIAIALFLEVFVFNINFYKSLGYNSIDLSDSLELQESSDEQYKITEVDNVIEFSNLNTEVHTVYLKFDWEQPAQNLTFKIHRRCPRNILRYDGIYPRCSRGRHFDHGAGEPVRESEHYGLR
mgnify:CR=1 FL=1